VPLCSLLSGGLDSSAVTAMAHRAVGVQQGGPIRSFSVDFADHGAAFVAGDFHKSSDTRSCGNSWTMSAATTGKSSWTVGSWPIRA
jgi:asparagine synthetase B (glutamine-hydrolysing)